MSDESTLLLRKLADPPVVERRRAERRNCNLVGSCWPLGDATSLPSRAAILNLSAGGIGLQTKRRSTPGTYMFVEMRCAVDGISRTFVVRVVHAQKVQAGGGWMMGCAFTNGLSDGDLEAYLS